MLKKKSAQKYSEKNKISSKLLNKMVFFLGPSGSGKTYTIEKLIFSNSNFNISTIKFIHHPSITIDPRAKDTRRHRSAGSIYTIAFAPSETSIMIGTEEREGLKKFENMLESLPAVDFTFVESLNNPPKGANVVLFVNRKEDIQEYSMNLNECNILGICSHKISLEDGKNGSLGFNLDRISEFNRLNKLMQVNLKRNNPNGV